MEIYGKRESASGHSGRRRATELRAAVSPSDWHPDRVSLTACSIPEQRRAGARVRGAAKIGGFPPRTAGIRRCFGHRTEDEGWLLLQDVRLAMRRMRRNPLFALSVAGTLAIGLAADDRDLHRRRRRAAEAAAVSGLRARWCASPPTTRRLDSARRRPVATGARGLRAAVGRVRVDRRHLADHRESDRLRSSGARRSAAGERATTSTCSACGPALGRTFTMRDEIPGIATVAVISDALWRRGFGGDPADPRPQAAHRRRRLRNHRGDAADVPPSHADTRDRYRGVGADRLEGGAVHQAVLQRALHAGGDRPGDAGHVDRRGARAVSRAWAPSWRANTPTSIPTRLGWTPRVHPLAADLVATVRPALLVLMGGITFVMLIAISNISNLLLIRAVAREREIAVQRALGASRWRIVSGVLAEGARARARRRRGRVPGQPVGRRSAAASRARQAAACVGHRRGRSRLPVCAADRRGRRPAGRSRSGAAVGAHRRRRSPEVVRQGRARRHAGPPAQHAGDRAGRDRRWCCSSAPACWCAASGTCRPSRPACRRRSCSRCASGCRSRTIPSPAPTSITRKRVALIRGVIDRLAASGEIRHAGLTTALPATRDSGSPAFAVEGWTPDRSDLATATSISVTPGYFPALGVRLVQGRLLHEQDDERAPRAAVINETLAKTYFRGEDPVGRRFHFVNGRGQVPPNSQRITIVGVVGDVKEDGHRRARATADLPVAAASRRRCRWRSWRAAGVRRRPPRWCSRRCSRSIRICRSMRCAAAKSSSPRSSRSAASRRA